MLPTRQMGQQGEQQQIIGPEDLLLMIGDREVEIYKLRKIIDAQNTRIADLTAKLEAYETKETYLGESDKGAKDASSGTDGRGRTDDRVVRFQPTTGPGNSGTEQIPSPEKPTDDLRYTPGDSQGALGNDIG